MILTIVSVAAALAATAQAVSHQTSETSAEPPFITHSDIEGDDCISLAEHAHIPLVDLILYNPVLAKDCKNVKYDQSYCTHTASLPSHSPELRTSYDICVYPYLERDSHHSPFLELYSRASAEGVRTVEHDVKYRDPGSAGAYHDFEYTNQEGLLTVEYDIEYLDSGSAGAYCSFQYTAPPKTTLTGQPHDCTTWHLVSAVDNCNSIVKSLQGQKFDISLSHLLAWNPSLGPGCAGLKPNTSLCLRTASGISSVKGTKKRWVTPGNFSQPATTKVFQRDAPPKVTCNAKTKNLPAPNVVASPPRTPRGSSMTNAISACCNKLAGRFLATGDAYLCDTTILGKQMTISLRVLKGGFDVSQKFCVEELFKVPEKCTTNEKTMGGCLLTADGNYQACIYT
ncbi:hypothetical protein TWF696_001543 [Orbilia brochopaga]|uniref:LysM domain-containing protein n=1 Tax=Orbilia brochopaga TaxID=3140254 RepID=A0AAV9UAN1_9PEZI